MEACQELLEKENVIDNMLSHASCLHQSLQTFGESVRGVIGHINVSRFVNLSTVFIYSIDVHMFDY